MSEEKSHRTPPEINNEYFQLCAKLGDFVVKQHGQALEEEKILARVKDLNVEMLESNAYFGKLQAELEAKKNEKPQG